MRTSNKRAFLVCLSLYLISEAAFLDFICLSLLLSICSVKVGKPGSRDLLYLTLLDKFMLSHALKR